MNVLVLGSGGREHAFAYKLAQSQYCKRLFVAPGNAGTAAIAENVPVGVNDFEQIKNVVLNNHISMVVVGPEDPLVNGIVDFFASDDYLKNVWIIGPDQAGAQLEGSKEFAKKFMQEFNIPTAAYRSFTKETLSEGLEYIENTQPPYVLKADGLAAGKGVVILQSTEEAKAELQKMLVDQKFGKAGATVVIDAITAR